MQNRKREKEKLEREFDEITKNEKIKNSSEVYIISNNNEKTNKIHEMNSDVGKFIKKERELVIKKHGSVLESNMPDQKRNLLSMSRQK